MTYTSPDSIFAALADPTRRQVFERLMKEPAPVGKLAKDFPVSRPAISQHLRVLNDAGLVAVEVHGTRRIYTARPEKLAELRAWLDRYWDGVLSRFQNEINNMKAHEND